MRILNFEDFIKKHKLKYDTMNESELQRVYNYKKFPRGSTTTTDKSFVKKDKGSMGGSR